MKATLTGRINGVGVSKETITLTLDVDGKDSNGRVASGTLTLNLCNTISNGAIQVGKTITITVSDEGERL